MFRAQVERRWESTTALSRAMRVALTPFSWCYGGAVALRNRLYDARVLTAHALGLPTVSVGNLTVGGTGKTPLAAWLAERLWASGIRPGILLRGYGDDEPEVHRRLVPSAVVVTGADRVAAAAHARALGARVLVLDDGFQHRRAARDADVVLISADRHRAVRLLPAGPWREPVSSLRRATHVVVTRKRTSLMHAREVVAFAARAAPQAEVAVVHLAGDAVVRWGTGEARPLATLAGQRVLAVAGVGDPRAFEAQLRDAGARVALRAFRDHHGFSQTDIETLAWEATGADLLVCTLKDAVKIGPGWPPSAPPVWYLSQRVSVEIGAEILEGLVRRLATLAPATDSSRRP
ncbi:MAG TPA: tetraacyldisaccharide 4'-kinase [Gemmatimonadaceae bacterium]|nr:tetraacyldisaccharide 4'-kinase [Gemmatimonadaceae bacterium]